jgi:hypothetical protein|tara:strand:+ start:203 stop:409 length:207 start_codon:yes stop_codon:yes gene_type:complete
MRAFGRWQPSGVLQGYTEQEIHLGVGTAEIIRCPSLQSIEYRGVRPERKAFFSATTGYWYREPVLATG